MEAEEVLKINIDDGLDYGLHKLQDQSGFKNYFESSGGNTPLILKKNGELFTGRVQLVDSVDKVKSQFNYERGLLSGKQIYYYDNGLVWSENIYKEGKLDGEQYSYYVNGKKAIETTFRNGEIVGNIVYYHENGNIQSEGKEDNNHHKTGHWIEYNEEGRKHAEGEWGMGGRHGNANIKKGEWKIYDKEGNLIEIQTYDPNLGTLLNTEKIKK